MKYDIKDKNGDVIRREEAFAWVANARRAEVSVVYEGATPRAAILKAQQEAEAGRLTPQQARFLENRYRAIKLVIPRIEASGARESEPAVVKPSPEPAEQEENEGELVELSNRYFAGGMPRSLQISSPECRLSQYASGPPISCL